MRCEEIMKANVECLSESDSVQTAARKMRDLNIGFLPVCDKDNRVVGTLTDRDITIRCCSNDLPVGKTHVNEVMTKEVIACRPDEDIDTAERLMAEHHKSRLVITDRVGVLTGVLSLSDLAERDEPKKVIKTFINVSRREVRPN
jgi:CBS domain-containing protein